MISCCSPIARGPSYRLRNGRELPSASKMDRSPARSSACCDGVLPGLGTAYAPSHDEAEHTLLRLNRKLDEKLILLRCEAREAVSRGAVEPDESECIEPRDGESPLLSELGRLLSTGHDIVTCDIFDCVDRLLKSCILGDRVEIGGIQGWRLKSNSQTVGEHYNK
jgi:hypothetical protein